MKRLQLLVLLIPVAVASAQESANPDLLSLVQAEKAFSRMAKEQNTRDAFIFFLSENAITAAPGQGPVKGKKHLESRPADEGWLFWRPTFSDIATSGDFGYNTGPWEFRQKRSDAEAVAYGQFVSLWKKDEHGEWKVAMDMGISHGKPVMPVAPSYSRIRIPSGQIASPLDAAELFNIEKRFIRDLRKTGSSAYTSRLSEEGRLLRPGHEPYVVGKAVRDLPAIPQETITYTLIGGEIAPSGELMCVYGKALRESMANDGRQTSVHSYLRFWKKEGGEWKIVVDLLSD